MNQDEYASTIRRRAIVMEIGGFRPPTDPSASWFGRVNLALPGEEWPHFANKPMLALAQINLTALPFRPPGLEDLELITVFIGPDELPSDAPNGEGWLLRAYSNVAQLTPLMQKQVRSGIKPFPMRPAICENDFPVWEDLDVEPPGELAESYYDLFENAGGFKLGGWPSLIQSEIYWAPGNRNPIAPRYVFQIDSTEKGNWAWGDGGVGYFGRGTAPGCTDQWAFEWQCY